ncbi:hypothetical protein MAPG_07655 [Magnaporthiopsis poae ATCC 64411]|uniref:Uncharacterized protein n=1 Tax=Magnaporthiopsis poae (strain ATCC 64411 / 73-15) TaxID=644358 RepID=A0A0C4E589_MAGP6|nr:hypothetical protein MAPG_07655 [Magnaporthiopsis poae ATCC 64411]
MAILKRKRSESELSFSSQFSSPPRPNDSSFFFPAAGVNLFPSARSPTPSNNGCGRTMKRFRDNRPSEEEIHRNTLDLLYSAAQRHGSAQPEELSPLATASQQRQQQQQQPFAAQTIAVSRQTSLHSFWKLPRQSQVAAQAQALPPMSVQTTPRDCATGCEDCGRDLRGEDGDAMEMDMDGDGRCGCSSCGKTVCFSCSVSNLGANRECLACAGRAVGPSRWSGGLLFG